MLPPEGAKGEAVMEREKPKGVTSPWACGSDITVREGLLSLDSLILACMHAFILSTAGRGGCAYRPC